MKKILIGMMALAATATAGAKTADELRVYINPGHGSWTANDRPCVIVGHKEYDRYATDTTSFFESNTNLRKGFGVLETLRSYGLKFDPTLNQTGDRHQIGAALDMSNNIVMSHVKCGPFHDDNGTSGQLGNDAPADLEYYNRSLSEIAAEVDANHFDMFISIHSNAASEGATTNYPLFLYRGWDDITKAPDEVTAEDFQSRCRAMADACWGYAFENPHMQWTHYSMTSKNLRGDINFYGENNAWVNWAGYNGYLGVLHHGVPGFLVEGYFHTYTVARHRAMNFDVDFLEGVCYARGIADYFGLEKESTGNIYGIVRDANERFVDKYFKPNTGTLDRFMPLNGVVAVLKKGDVEVARYTTDNNYNGAFVFKGLEPGDYTVTFESEQYLPCEPVEVTVTAAGTAYPVAQLVDKDWVAPDVVYENYPDPLAGNAAVSPAPKYNVETVYKDEPIAALEGLNVKRTIVRDGKMYILALDKELTIAAVVPVEEQPVATILVYDLAKKEVIANVSTAGAAGSIAAISDIQLTSDGYLLACNATKNQYDDSNIQEGDAGRGTFVVYKWENDAKGVPTGDPVEWITTQNSGLWFRAYPVRFAYSGTSQEGHLIIPMPTITDPYKSRATYIGVTAGEAGAATDLKPADPVAIGESINTINLFTSPLDETQFIQVDPVLGTAAYNFADGFNNVVADGNEELNGIDSRVGIFRYAGASYVVVPAVEEGNVTGVKLVNISNGVNAAAPATVAVAEELAPVATTSMSAAGETCVKKDELTGAVREGWINLYLLRDGKVTMLTTQGVQQPQGRREYAYNVKAEEGEDAYTVTFDATGAAPEATVRLTAEDGEELTYAAGAVNATGNEVVIAKSDLDPEKSYTWAVEVVSEPIAQAGLVSADASGLTVRGSVIPITDPEVASFGYTVVGHGANKGVDIYNPAGEKVASRLYVDNKELGGVTTNQSNPIRGDERDGYACLGTWGDSGYGIVAINPVDTDEAPFTLFAGEKQGYGHFMYNGVNLGGGLSGFSFVGPKDDSWVISFSEDHEGKNGSGATENTLVKYHLGGGWTITEAPEVIGYHSFLANTNVDVVTYGEGVFVSQIRGAGNNQTSVPCFAYISNILTDDNDIEMTSADDATSQVIDNNTSGIAISKDGKLFAAAMANSIAVCSVEWNGVTPTLTHLYTFAVPAHTWSTMRFDAAGNLHAYLREGGYRVFSLPDARPVAVTPGNSVLKGMTSVVEIDLDEATADTDAVYYNLQGVRVAASQLTTGIYVKVAGTNATKVLVK